MEARLRYACAYVYSVLLPVCGAHICRLVIVGQSIPHQVSISSEYVVRGRSCSNVPGNHLDQVGSSCYWCLQINSDAAKAVPAL